MIYLALAIIALFFHEIQFFADTRKANKYQRWIFLGLLCIISGFRFQVGTDYKHYQAIYNLLLNGEPSYVEIGFKILNYPFFIFGESGFYVLVFVVSTFIIASFDYFITKFIDQRYYFLSWFFVLTSGMVFSSYNAIRQYIAIAIFIFSIQSIRNKKIFHYIAYVVVACLFHSSAIVLIMMLPLFFLDTKHGEGIERMYLVLYALSIVFLVVDFREILKAVWFIVPRRWYWYIQSEFFTSRNYSAIVKQVMPNILQIFILISTKEVVFRGKNKRDKINFETITYYGFILFVSLSNIFYGIMVLQRFVLYFEIFMIPVIIKLIRKKSIEIKGYKISRKWVVICFILYFTIFYLYLIFVRNAHDIIPYRTIIEVL